jgi:hypothetical protein
MTFVKFSAQGEYFFVKFKNQQLLKWQFSARIWFY